MRRSNRIFLASTVIAIIGISALILLSMDLLSKVRPSQAGNHDQSVPSTSLNLNNTAVPDTTIFEEYVEVAAPEPETVSEAVEEVPLSEETDTLI